MKGWKKMKNKFKVDFSSLLCRYKYQIYICGTWSTIFFSFYAEWRRICEENFKAKLTINEKEAKDGWKWGGRKCVAKWDCVISTTLRYKELSSHSLFLYLSLLRQYNHNFMRSFQRVKCKFKNKNWELFKFYIARELTEISWHEGDICKFDF